MSVKAFIKYGMDELSENVVSEMFKGNNRNPIVRTSTPYQMRILASLVLLESPLQRKANIKLL